MKYLFLCLIRHFCLLFISIVLFILGLYYIINDLFIFIEWEIVSINSLSIVITLLLDWIFLLFIRFVLLISSLVILYREDYTKGDITLNQFIFFRVNICTVNISFNYYT